METAGINLNTKEIEVMFGCARIDRMEENGKWPWLEDGLSGKQM